MLMIMLQKTKELLICRLGSGVLSGNMLLVRIVKNHIIDDYFRTG